MIGSAASAASPDGLAAASLSLASCLSLSSSASTPDRSNWRPESLSRSATSCSTDSSAVLIMLKYWRS